MMRIRVPIPMYIALLSSPGTLLPHLGALKPPMAAGIGFGRPSSG